MCLTIQSGELKYFVFDIFRLSLLCSQGTLGNCERFHLFVCCFFFSLIREIEKSTWNDGIVRVFCGEKRDLEKNDYIVLAGMVCS